MSAEWYIKGPLARSNECSRHQSSSEKTGIQRLMAFVVGQAASWTQQVLCHSTCSFPNLQPCFSLHYAANGPGASVCTDKREGHRQSLILPRITVHVSYRKEYWNTSKYPTKTYTHSRSPHDIRLSVGTRLRTTLQVSLPGLKVQLLSSWTGP